MKRNKFYDSYQYDEKKDGLVFFVKYRHDSEGSKKSVEEKLVHKDYFTNTKEIKNKDIVIIPNLSSEFVFLFNKKGLLTEIKPIGVVKWWSYYNIQYDNNDRIIEVTSEFEGKPDYIKHHKFIRHDAYGNWLEADVYIGNDEEPAYTFIREIEYWEPIKPSVFRDAL